MMSSSGMGDTPDATTCSMRAFSASELHTGVGRGSGLVVLCHADDNDTASGVRECRHIARQVTFPESERPYSSCLKSRSNSS
jgi:hypothetical protein